MNTTIRILKIVFAVILLLFAAVFAMIEGRLLVSGDWFLHEIPFLSFLCYFSRFVLTLLAGYFACRFLFVPKKK